VRAEVGEHRTVGQPVARQHRRGLGQHNLAAVRDRRDPGRPVNVQPEHAGSGRLRAFAGVDSHPHPHGLPTGPGVSLEG